MGVGPEEVGQTGMTQGGGAGGKLVGCADSEGCSSAASTGCRPKGMGREGSTCPSGKEKKGEHTIGVTWAMETPGMSRAVLGADFLEYLEEMGAGPLAACL